MQRQFSVISSVNSHMFSIRRQFSVISRLNGHMFIQHDQRPILYERVLACEVSINEKNAQSYHACFIFQTLVICFKNWQVLLYSLLQELALFLSC